MAFKKIVTIFVLMSLIFSIIPISISAAEEKRGSDVESFLGVMSFWGRILSRLTGSLDFAKNMLLFSKLVRGINLLVEENALSPAGFVKLILRKLGVEFFTAPRENNDKSVPYGSYSI